MIIFFKWTISLQIPVKPGNPSQPRPSIDKIPTSEEQYTGYPLFFDFGNIFIIKTSRRRKKFNHPFLAREDRGDENLYYHYDNRDHASYGLRL
jgi:hypothetical protein